MIPKPPHLPTPCGTCAKIPDDQPKVKENAKDLTPKLWQVYYHDQVCKAVNRWEEDYWVERHAFLIRKAESRAMSLRQIVRLIEEIQYLLIKGKH